MPIKQSFLEKKWYYRVAKTLFLILPLLVIAAFFLMGKININFIFQKDIVNILQKNVTYIVYGVLLVIAYYLFLKLIWRIFLYIFFGGLEDDRKTGKGTVQSAVQIVQHGSLSAKDKKEIGSLIGWLILIILIYIIYNYQAPSQKHYNINNSPTCVPTGCGNLWHSSCTNKCYSTKSDCIQTGSGCSGNVTCRQCP